MSVHDIAEQMAYDLTQNEDFVKRMEREKQLEASRGMSAEERTKQFKALLEGVANG